MAKKMPQREMVLHEMQTEVHSMTIDEALEELDTLIIPRDGIQDRLADAYDMAIATLKAWDKAYNKFKELSTIKNFHGLQFKDKHLVSLEYVVEYMDECLNADEGDDI